MTITRFAVVAAFIAIAGTLLSLPFSGSEAAVTQDPLAKMYQRSAPNFDLNLSRNLQNVRVATGEQIAALNNLKATVNAPNMTARWNDFGGSPDVMYDFASQSFAGTPEEAGRAFLNQNAALFGLSNMNTVRVFSQKEALGGHLIRFQQVFNGVPVTDGGIRSCLEWQQSGHHGLGPVLSEYQYRHSAVLKCRPGKSRG